MSIQIKITVADMILTTSTLCITSIIFYYQNPIKKIIKQVLDIIISFILCFLVIFVIISYLYFKINEIF